MKWLLLSLLLPGSLLRAELLAEFSCVRPKAVDEGTWHNVSLAARLVNGSVLAPGGEFSFLRAIAPGNGRFKPGNSFSNGRVIKSTGGGYCQVSTALYNAALLAGMPVVERYPHSFYDAEEAYVDPGRDAAVSGSSHADFRFLNASPSALTLVATAKDGRVAIQIYGKGPAKKRWIATEAERIPMKKVQRQASRPRPGHDGWRVKRSLNVVDAQGNTRSSNLGTDLYDMVAEIE